jgi:epoxyqueuosine reductase QueG
VVTTAELEPDRMLETPLCLGEECGRCLLACPGDAIGDWELDLERCRPYSSPYGYHFLRQHVERVLQTPDRAARAEVMRSTDTLMLWQSMLRGVGIYSGCTRCYDVCPVGVDYEPHLRDIQEDIPEATPEKHEKLRAIQALRARAVAASGLRQHARWIGRTAA